MTEKLNEAGETWDDDYGLDPKHQPTNNPNETPLDMTWDYCPSCAGELDTGFECNSCGRDWRPWATVYLNVREVEDAQ